VAGLGENLLALDRVDSCLTPAAEQNANWLVTA